MMRILICMMAAVALAILVVSGCGEVKDRCHETGNREPGYYVRDGRQRIATNHIK